MATTIQVAEDVRIGAFINIEGKRCEVEAASFTKALTEKASQEELLNVFTEYLTDEGVIKLVDSQYVWCDSNQPVVPDEDYEDEE
ncbi:hypothetical protein [Vibrio parahaemolyticus]|uniref:hypothetical protein n=1 Tax=Vibrio parahaemolyticus TaxID=670 RepID=UPI000C9B80DB|nr:hypothetical protein [Vibrio parahaemolyticus]PMS91925.1 hypothetical protein C1T06_22800 [Vibrio parahaemolyticus]